MSWCCGSYFKLLRALDGDGKAWYIIHTKRMYGGLVRWRATSILKSREERILQAAERLFLEKGYDNTTIQDIVDALGDLTKGAVYHHFKSKEDIMEAVGDRMFVRNNPFAEAAARKDLNGVGKAPRFHSDEPE